MIAGVRKVADEETVFAVIEPWKNYLLLFSLGANFFLALMLLGKADPVHVWGYFLAVAAFIGLLQYLKRKKKIDPFAVAAEVGDVINRELLGSDQSVDLNAIEIEKFGSDLLIYFRRPKVLTARWNPDDGLVSVLKKTLDDAKEDIERYELLREPALAEVKRKQHQKELLEIEGEAQ